MSIRTNTRDVAYYWYNNKAACNNGAGNLWTDGKDIYSYRLCIGTTGPNGEKIVKEYRSGTEYGFRSMTTSKHVGYVAGRATHWDDGVELTER